MKHVFLFGIFGWLLSFTLVAQTGIKGGETMRVKVRSV